MQKIRLADFGLGLEGQCFGARKAWSELSGNGEHGLRLKSHLRLNFRHHDGEEDARASAEVVLMAIAETGLSLEQLCGSGKKSDAVSNLTKTVTGRAAPMPYPALTTVSLEELKKLVPEILV